MIQDVIVIGNGILGLSTVFALLKEDPSLSVTILAADQKVGDATSAAGAMMGAFGEITKSKTESGYGKWNFQLALRSRDRWDAWLEEINEYSGRDKLRITPGTYVISNTIGSYMDDENYEAILAALSDQSEPYDVVNPREIGGLEPAVDMRPLKAVYIPGEGSLNPNDVLAALHACVERLGARVVHDSVETLLTRSDAVVGVQTRSGTKHSAKNIIVAAGSYSQKILDTAQALARRIPRIFAGQGISIVCRYPKHGIEGVVRTPNRAYACGLHVVRRDDDHMYVGATNTASFTPQEHCRIGPLTFLSECFLDQINHRFPRSEIVQIQSGNRPMTIDTFPLIGGTSMPGLWLLTGTYRTGFQQSPIFSAYLAGKILKDTELFDNPFLPERRPLQSFTKQTAIEELQKHFAAEGYEHSRFNVPRVGWSDHFARMYKNMAEEFYDRLDVSNFVVPPDFFPMVQRDREFGFDALRKYLATLNNDEPYLGPRTETSADISASEYTPAK